MMLTVKPGNKLSVLVVDDEPDIREALREFLQMMECFQFIVEAKDGQDAFMKTQNQNFDLIITDLMMPKASGLDLISSLKRRKTQSSIMILSANLTNDEVKQAIGFGVKHLLTKPCTAEDFIGKVSEALLKDKSEKVRAS